MPFKKSSAQNVAITIAIKAVATGYSGTVGVGVASEMVVGVVVVSGAVIVPETSVVIAYWSDSAVNV